MATKAKQKTSFKDRVKAATNKVKTYGQNYKADIYAAYSIGYNQGLQDGANIPNRAGTRTAAVFGYNKGIGAYRKKNKRNKRK